MTKPSPQLLHILLIEDSKGDAILIKKALEDAMLDAYEVQHAVTIEEALQYLDKQKFDVVLLDRSLPDAIEFSGLHCIQNRAPGLPVIFLTAYKDETVALEAIQQGAQDYVFKDNFDARVIKRAIQYAVLRKGLEGSLMQRANFDMLTGLANRTMYENRLDIALAKKLRTQKNVAVLFLDLDKFKPVNDQLGHAVGDILLKDVAQRLQGLIRAHDLAARFGGDEFAVLIEELEDREQCEVIAQKMISLFDNPFTINEHVILVDVSIGVVFCAVDQTMTRQDMMTQADKAMYIAKKKSGNSYHFPSS